MIYNIQKLQFFVCFNSSTSNQYQKQFCNTTKKAKETQKTQVRFIPEMCEYTPKSWKTQKPQLYITQFKPICH